MNEQNERRVIAKLEAIGVLLMLLVFTTCSTCNHLQNISEHLGVMAKQGAVKP